MSRCHSLDTTSDNSPTNIDNHTRKENTNMSYDKDIAIIVGLLKDSTINELFTGEETEALNDAISALKTLQDMGEAMNQFLRENHKEN